MKSAIVILGFSSFVFLVACGSGPTKKATRGKLSEAIVVSSDNHTSDRQIIGSIEDEDKREDETNQPPIIVNNEKLTKLEVVSELKSNSVRDSENVSERLLFSKGGGDLSSGEFEYQEHLSLGYGWKSINNEFIVQLEHQNLSLDRDGFLYDSIDGSLSIISWGGEYHRNIITNKYLEAYFVIGGGWSILSFGYRNEFTALDGTKISSDSVEGINIIYGAGISFRPSKKLSISAKYTPKLFVWDGVTRESFENDVFRDFLSYSTLISLEIGF